MSDHCLPLLSGCNEGYNNGPIIAWSEVVDNHNVDIIVARLNRDNADNAIASGGDQRPGAWVKLGIETDTRGLALQETEILKKNKRSGG